MTKYLAALAAVAAMLPLSASTQPHARPALARVLVVVSTQSRAVDLTLEAGTIVHAAALPDSRGLRVRAAGNTLSFTRDGDGAAEAKVRLLVSGVRAGTRVPWRVDAGASAQTDIEVYNENVATRTRLVDRFETQARTATFDSPSEALLRGDPVTVGERAGALVFSFYYPWYTHGTWLNERLRDRSLYQYSTEYPEEIAWSVVKARGAGLDALIVSWVGDTDWNDRRLGFVLDEAQKVGLKVAVMVETLFATDFLADGVTRGPSADRMERWLEQAYVEFGHHPAFLKVRGKPVAFVYVADAFTPAEWRGISATLQRAQRRPFLMADSLDPAFLDAFDGEFTYASAQVPARELVGFYADQALKTQSYHLAFGGERRVAAATVSPGYDDTLLVDRATTVAIDRQRGAFYDAQWEAAMSAAPDWVLITSWNEFFENTHIEPSEVYGYQYLRRTRTWADTFREGK